LTSSLRLRLSAVLATVILVTAVLAGTFSFMAAFDEAIELQDDTLREVAALVVRQGGAAAGARADAHASHNRDARVLVEMLDPHAASAPLPLPANMPEGFSTRTVGHAGWRILVRTLDDGRRVAIAQETDLRDDAAQDSALRTVLPLAILMVVLLVAVAVLVRQLVGPITAAARELDGRDAHDLAPLDAGAVPDEVRPFVVALNRMLERLAAALAAQRRFVADAAHELRTPMTAIALQAERLAHTPMPDEAAARLATLRQGIERGKALLDQLLSLARVQSRPLADEREAPVRPVLLRVLEDVLPLAESKDVDLGLAGPDDLTAALGEADLYKLARNLVDNAIRYGPRGGRVDVAVRAEDSHVVIDVMDEGPGIPAAERTHVFAPFHRGAGADQEGTGLGLAIVAAIAAKAGGSVTLHERQPGLRAEARLPRRT
jgi:two-component system OmpR family sensor kinase